MTRTTADTAQRRKRSRHARLALAGAAAFSLSACREEVEATAFPTLDECLAAAETPGSWVSAESCEEGFSEALAVHQDAAPRYDEQALCESEHGTECIVDERSGGGSIFLPIMAGYLLGNMMSNRGGLRSQPLYSTKAGGFATAGGATQLSSNRGSANLGSHAFRAPPSTAGAAPMTKATVSRTGGFGAARTAPRGVGFGG